MATRSKLAVILHADVVGSTALVRMDERIAHDRIQSTFRRFSKTIVAYGGVTHELRGDALLAEFSRASDAVTAALAFQADNVTHNASLEDDIRADIRIGISLGEIVVADDTLTGPDVVLAQRLEQLARPACVCISQAVRQSLPRRLPFRYEDLGDRRVKGFDEPIRAYAVTLEADEPIPAPEPGGAEASVTRRGSRRHTRLLAATVVVFLLAAGGGVVWWQPWKLRFEPASVEKMAYPMPDKPSIAVLPFTNMSNEPGQEYFADGMTDDLITDLSKISGLFVIARNSMFTFKGRSVEVQRVAEDLGIRYVLEGSVRRVGERLRVNAQLVDATTGGHVWAERYDVEFADVFSVQDRVTRKIVDALAIRLTAREEAERANPGTTDPQAYDAFLRGWVKYRGDTPEDLAQAVSFLDKAIRLDPGFSRAHAALAAVYWSVVDRDRSGGSTAWSRTLGISTSESRRLEGVHLAKAIENPTPLAYRVAAGRLSRQGDHDAAIERARQAIAMDPGDPVAHEAMATALIYAGMPAEAEVEIQRAMRLDPQFSHNYLYWRGLAHFGMGRFQAAAKDLYRAAAGNPYDESSLIVLAAALGHLGRSNDAETALDTANALRARRSSRLEDSDMQAGIDTLLVGPYTLADVDLWPFKERTDRDRLSEGLRLAGVPTTGQATQTSPLEVDGATTVNASGAKALFDRGALFVDVRDDASWKSGRVPGAVHLFLKDDFNETALSRFAEREREIVLYCMGQRCLLSSTACAEAVAWGFKKVFYFRDGFPSWRAAGYPVEAGG